MKKLFILLAIILIGCSRNIQISPILQEDARYNIKPSEMTGFSFHFTSNPRADNIQITKRRLDNKFRYSLSSPFKNLLNEWFYTKFKSNVQPENEINISINDIEHETINDNFLTSALTHSVQLTVGVELIINKQKYLREFSFRKTIRFNPNEANENIGMDKDIIDLLETFITAIDTYTDDTIAFIQNFNTSRIYEKEKENEKKETIKPDKYVVLEPLNLRVQPDWKSKKILVLRANQIVEKKTELGDWVLIEYFDHAKSKMIIGWVYGKYIQNIDN
ncbi:MAG: SH3 domain-containing protein [Armatimonadetes bacterium]|nr:SH3 domain-containing protein [Armatimonadota bacterium]